ncbi:MAG: M14 family metallopeptidase [Phycisphaerales bacterium]
MILSVWMRGAVLGVVLAAGAPSNAQEAARPVRYDGHRAVRVTVQTLREYRTVLALSDDILTCEGSGIGTFDVRVSPEKYPQLAAAGVRHEVLIPDIQRHVDQIWADDAAIRAGAGGGAADDLTWFSTYRSLAEIEARLATLAGDYNTLATLSDIGTSIQNRQIKMIRITGPGSTANRPAFFIQANQHAREWVTPMSAMYIVDRFLETYGTDPRVTNIVNNVDFYIVPCANPDGYQYSRTTNSQWRKNRRDNPGTSCDGVDLNRNWGFQWGYDNTGSSGNPCSETFRGSAGFSEPELTALRGVADMLGAQGRLKVHWDIHANAQQILSPWGYTTNPPPHLPLMDQLGLLIHEGMESIRNTQYEYGQGSVILYLNNGNTRDYSYGVHGAMAWTIEMTGSSFQPNVSQILPIAQECLAGLMPLAEHYIVPPPPACYPNCDGSTAAPVLNVQDFGCFLTRYAAGEAWANCDESTVPPVLNVQDFGCFLTKYAAGCP